MDYDTTLAAVRSLSENATLRPAARRLRLNKPGPAAPPRHALIAFEDLQPIHIGHTQGTAGNYKLRGVYRA